MRVVGRCFERVKRVEKEKSIFSTLAMWSAPQKQHKWMEKRRERAFPGPEVGEEAANGSKRPGVSKCLDGHKSRFLRVQAQWSTCNRSSRVQRSLEHTDSTDSIHETATRIEKAGFSICAWFWRFRRLPLLLHRAKYYVDHLTALEHRSSQCTGWGLQVGMNKTRKKVCLSQACVCACVPQGFLGSPSPCDLSTFRVVGTDSDL